MNKMESKCPVCGGTYTAKVEIDGLSLSFDCDHDKEIFFDAAEKLADSIVDAERVHKKVEEAVREIIDEKGVEVAPGRWAIVEDDDERKELEVRSQFARVARLVIQDYPDLAPALTMGRKYDATSGILSTKDVEGETVTFIHQGWMDLSPVEQISTVRKEAENIMKHHVDHCLNCVSYVTGENCVGCRWNRNDP